MHAPLWRAGEGARRQLVAGNPGVQRRLQCGSMIQAMHQRNGGRPEGHERRSPKLVCGALCLGGTLGSFDRVQTLRKARTCLLWKPAGSISRVVKARGDSVVPAV